MTHVILGTGSQLPERVVSNDEIELSSTDFDRQRAGQPLDDWLRERAGVVSRHRADPGEVGIVEMAQRATERALADAGLTIADIDLIVLGTFTSGSRLPATVTLLAQRLGARAKCLQLATACTGFLDAVFVATSLLGPARYRTALVVCVEAMSAVVDPRRFLGQSIFGDGAAAVVIRDQPGSPYGIEAIRTHTDATHCDWTRADQDEYLTLDHRSIYGFAVEKMVDATWEVLTAADLSVDDVDWLLPHQTGLNIIAETAERLKIPAERVITCLEHTGNVSGASVAIALDEAQRAGRLADGDRIVIPVVGAGMAWGGICLVWRQPRPDWS